MPPRSSFIPKIQRFVARLEKQNTHTLEEKNDFLGRTDQTTFRVVALHAFGSFARGAPTCGDLDLILYVERLDGVWCSERRMIRHALGNTSGVDVLCGERSRFESEFPEQKVLWSPERPNLEQNLAEIPLQTDAGRFDRKTDLLPVSLKQLRTRRADMEHLVDSIEAGKFTSTWVPLETIHVDRTSWSAELVRMEKIWINNTMGKDTGKLLPYVIQYSVDRVRCYRLSEKIHSDRSCVQIGGVYSYIGQPQVLEYLLDGPDTSALVMAPHIKKGYPAGLWVLERGPKHPSILAFEQLSVWVESQDGRPMGIVDATHDYIEYEAMELYRTEQDAQEFFNDMGKDDGVPVPVQLSGRALLEVISDVEGVLGVDCDIVRNRDVTALELAERLRAWLAEPQDS